MEIIVIIGALIGSLFANPNIEMKLIDTSQQSEVTKS